MPMARMAPVSAQVEEKTYNLTKFMESIFTQKIPGRYHENPKELLEIFAHALSGYFNDEKNYERLAYREISDTWFITLTKEHRNNLQVHINKLLDKKQRRTILEDKACDILDKANLSKEQKQWLSRNLMGLLEYHSVDKK